MRVLIVLIAMLAYSQMQPSFKSEQPRVKHSNGHTNTADKSDQKGNGNPETAIAQNQNANPSVSEKDAQAKKQSDDDRTHEIFYRAYVIFTVIGSVAAIIALIVLIVQTKATKRAADAAMKNADALMGIERAWILAEKSKPKIVFYEQRQTVMVPITFKNRGNSPAYVFDLAVRCQSVTDLSSLPVIPAYASDMVFQSSPRILPRKKTIIAEVRLSDGQFTGDDWRKVREGALFLYVWGRIRYRDIFEREHETRFCFAYDPRYLGFTEMIGGAQYNMET
jgi:hypothetical protein